MPDLHYQQERMLALVRSRGILDERVLAAMKAVPRELFVRGHLLAQAYGDFALPIGGSQTISQPYVVARMTEMLAPRAEDSVLEIGGGSGYQTAILSHLCRRVFSIERRAELAQEALKRIQQLGLQNVKIQILDGTTGWSGAAPYEGILVAAGAPEAPAPLLDQLAVGGRLVIPEGDRSRQRLVKYVRGRRGVRRTEGEAVAFVPLLGRYGWQEDD